MGFGQSGRLHKDRPLPLLDEMMESGLVTTEKAHVLQYGRQRASLFARLKQSLWHPHETTRQ